MSSTMVSEAQAPPRPHPADPVGVLAAAVDGLAGRPVGGLTDTEAVDTLAGVRAQIDRLEALSAELLATVDRRGIPAQDGEASTVGWYATRAGLPRRQAAAQVVCARTLADELPRLRQAAARGAVCWAKVRTAASHAARVGGGLFAGAEPVLLGAATELSVAQFEALCKALRARAEALLDTDPDREAFHRRYLQVSPVGDLVRIDGQLDRADGQTLLAALDALCNPATTPTTPKHGETGGDGQDLRTARARRADALVWLAAHALNTADLPQAGGHRPHLNVLVDLPTLQAEATRLLGADANRNQDTHLSAQDAYQASVDQAARLLPQIAAALTQQIRTNRHPGGAWTDHQGGPLPPADLLRHACDATLRRIVTDTTGQPLDVGAAHRVVPAPLRAAITARDRRCAHPGCDRPPAWCEAHHLIHHLHGGPTQATNLALVCAHHHRRLHKTGHTLTRQPDGTWQVTSYTHALQTWKQTGHPPGLAAGP